MPLSFLLVAVGAGASLNNRATLSLGLKPSKTWIMPEHTAGITIIQTAGLALSRFQVRRYDWAFPNAPQNIKCQVFIMWKI